MSFSLIGSTQLSSSVIKFVGAVVIPEDCCEFVVSERFVVNTANNNEVNICSIWEDFFDPKFFYDKIEAPVRRQQVRCYELSKNLFDGGIIAELGGYSKAETTLRVIYSLMMNQKNGGTGMLLNTGYSNIFYIQSVFEKLCVVDVRWSPWGWRIFTVIVNTGTLKCEDMLWHKGSRVFVLA